MIQEMEISIVYHTGINLMCMKCKKEFYKIAESKNDILFDQIMIMHHMDCGSTQFRAIQGITVETVGA